MSFRKFAAFCLVLALPATAMAQSGLPRMLYSRGAVSSQAVNAELLDRHNVERRALGVLPLTWDPALAAGAQAYANELVRLNLLRHSPRSGRRGVG